jgi:uncharacterized protein
MKISMYAASVGSFTRLLTNLDKILDKTVAWADSRRIEHSVLLNARLAPDMFSLTRQVQIMSDNAKGTVARLAGIDPPAFEDNEQSFADLKARVAKTLAFLQTVKEAQLEGSEDRAITLQVGPPGNKTTFNFTGLDYLLGWGTPNVYFHYTAVYAILRHNGLDIGKRDYLG